MATKALKNENQLLRSEIQDLKSQLNKVSQDLNTQMSIAKTAIEKTQDNANPNHFEGEEQSKAIEFLSKQYDDLHAFRKQASQDLNRIDKNLDKVSRRCDEIAEAIEASEEYSYQYNIKITNVPQISERESAEATAKLCVKLFSAMGVEDVSLQDIDIAHRVPHRRASQYPNAIICKFVRRLAKRKVMAARKESSSVTSEQLGIGTISNPDFRVNIYDHLTPRLQSLLYETKKYQKTMGYKFCWVKNSYICLRKAENSRMTKMKSLQDLTNLIQQDSTGNDSMMND
ncbi:Hypothetical predicted protein [Paramuricea clavata]|uniref:FP protein C-terminal domain-containing protein n=1 Tax=Paramuricea clavata TaxID=317549 RepID=A0A6S7HD77_PARCT|nr:Hypothetical predicted protein [Paramuricea clavata]